MPDLAVRRLRLKRSKAGLCVYCGTRPALLSKTGCKRIYCAPCRQDKYTWLRQKYRPPKNLVPLNAFSQLDPKILAYAAGLLEGEGCFFVGLHPQNFRRPYCRLQVKMTDIEALKWCQSIFGGQLYVETPRGNRKLAHRWHLSARPAGAVAVAIYPYMKIARKKAEARLLIKIACVSGWFERCTIRRVGVDVIRKLRISVEKFRESRG